MSTAVQISGATVTVNGTPGSLAMTEPTFFGPQGLTVTDPQEALTLLQALVVELPKAFPNLALSVTSKA